MPRTLTTTLLLLLLPAIGWAHGPAPTPLRVLVAQNGVPRVVSTNLGIATHRVDDDLYDYVCPSQWGGIETPLATAEGDLIFVLGTDDLYWSADVACGLQRSHISAIDPGRAVAFAAGPGGGVILAHDGERTTVAWGALQNGPSLQTLSLPGRIDGVLWTGDAFLAVGARPTLTAHRIVGGDAESWEPEAAAGGLQRLSPRYATGSSVYFSAVTDDGVALWRSDDGGNTLIEVHTGALSLHGPAGWCGGVVAVVDGALVADPAAPPACDITAFAGSRFQCLHEVDGTSFVCQNRVLYALTDAGADPVWDFDQLRGPDCLAQECTQDWLHFGAEAGLIDLDMPDAGDIGGVEPHPEDATAGDVAPGTPAPADCTCSMSAAAALPGWLPRRR